MDEASALSVSDRRTLREVEPRDLAAWCALREALWPDEDALIMARDAREYFERTRKKIAFLAFDAADVAIGFAEATIRSDYVNGTETSPVGFLEGLYVAPTHRRRGIGRALVAAVELWVREQLCSEIASDAWLDNKESHLAHHAYGFVETERVVYFRKSLDAR